MRAYYNEHDPRTAAWLRALIQGGQIAPGDVDERSIVEVTAGDLHGYTHVPQAAQAFIEAYRAVRTP